MYSTVWPGPGSPEPFEGFEAVVGCASEVQVPREVEPEGRAQVIEIAC